MIATKPRSGTNYYTNALEEAWNAHLSPKLDNSPTVISTFAGCGGSSLGYSMAGFHELLAVEWENDAAECFAHNFPDVQLYHGDINDLTVEECLKRAGIKVGELDCFDGSPPCQGFSMAGDREFSDTRNQLFRQFCRLLKGLQSKAFVMENVSGMIRGDMRLTFAECLRELKACGYRVKVRLLNTAYYGVPQARERMVFIGIREDLNIEPSHPAPTHARPVTVRDAWVGLSGRGDAPLLTDLYMDYWLRAKQGKSVGKLMCNKKLVYDRPAFTLTKEGNSPYHPFEQREVNSAERKRLASFPDPFWFKSHDSCTKRIGNSVPPFLMRAIANHLRGSILETNLQS